MKLYIHTLIALLVSLNCVAQYAPQAGEPGTTAIYKDDSSLVEWASASVIKRGWQNIADTTLGRVTVGDSLSAIGRVGQNGIVSLGDGGMATLTFPNPIYNGTGYDFAIFENGFPTGDSLAFLELAFVEVSSDGVNFFRFKASSHNQDTTQMAMAGMDCRLINNLAGKYTNGYGTPFDLDELKNENGLDVNNITHVRIIDVVGSINPLYATYDTAGHKINDPYPTAFPSSGFDLEAVGVFYAVGISSVNEMAYESITVYPNPVKDVLNINVAATEQSKLALTDLNGRIVLQSVLNAGETTIGLPALQTGIYFLSIQSTQHNYVSKILVE